jgi:hypothetical protein
MDLKRLRLRIATAATLRAHGEIKKYTSMSHPPQEEAFKGNWRLIYHEVDGKKFSEEERSLSCRRRQE